MAVDRHKGRSTPTFVVEGDPNKYIGLINRHGVFARIMRARVCPCTTTGGQPDIYCNQCRGDGLIYDFQRKLLQADEDSDVRTERNVIYPFRVPILEPISVERMLPDEQGGIRKYDIIDFDAFTIKIGGHPQNLPRHYNEMRVSYYFDRYNYVDNEYVEVEPATKRLFTKNTLFDDEYRTSNQVQAHGDITIIEKLVDDKTGHVYQNYTFRKNVVMLDDSEPTPTKGYVRMSYFYAPVTRVLPTDFETANDQETWTHALESGTINIGVEPWYELGQGDLITFWSTFFYRDQVVIHSGQGYDQLNEFDIHDLDDIIFDEDGVRYRKGVDFYLQPFRSIVWVGNQPNAGKKISVRYSYCPTYRIFRENPVPNRLENKFYPTTFMAKRFAMGLPKDVETQQNTDYNVDKLQFPSMDIGSIK